MSRSNRTGGRYSATLLEIFKWIVGYFAPPIVGIVLIALSDNYVGKSFQIWLLPAGMVLIWSWVLCFTMSKIEVGADADSIVTIGFAVAEFIAAAVMATALLATPEFATFPLLFGAHLMAFAIFRTLRYYLVEKQFTPGGLNIAYVAVGVILIILAIFA